jgi:predicted RNA-binding Zn-ribbon protein involved in translation (DUF1610 family)
MAAEAGEFNLIVMGVEESRRADAARRFAQSFSVDSQLATQICASAPIVLVQELTKAEVKDIGPTLVEMSKYGVEFRVTARDVSRLPTVRWAVRPQIASGRASGGEGAAFSWNHSAFVCPGCGETYLFRPSAPLRSNGA